MINSISKNKFKKSTHIKTKTLTPKLQKCPQKKGWCDKIFLQTPKKPNSALRKVARVFLSNKKRALTHIPGVGHNLQKFSTVLIRGGRTKDLPGYRYKAIRGKFDLRCVFGRFQGRSKYGGRKVWM